MTFSVIPTDVFKKAAKRLIQKFPSLKKELEELNGVLSSQPLTGTPLGSNIFKVRLAIKSKGKGKKG